MQVRIIYLAICTFTFSIANSYTVKSSNPPPMTNISFEYHAGIDKIVAATPFIKVSTKKQNYSMAFKLVGIFDSKGNPFDQQLYVVSEFSDWAYLEKAKSDGEDLDLTVVKKELICKVNPCVYTETVAIRFATFDKLKMEAQKKGTYRFQLIGKSIKQDYAIARSYFKSFVDAIEINKARIKQKTSLKIYRKVVLNTSTD